MKKTLFAFLLLATGLLFAAKAQDTESGKPHVDGTASVASVTTFATTVGQRLHIRVWEKGILKEDAYATITSVQRNAAGDLTKVVATTRNVLYGLNGHQTVEESFKDWTPNAINFQTVRDLRRIDNTVEDNFTVSNKSIKILKVDTGASKAGFAITQDGRDITFPGMVYLETGNIVVRLVEILDPESK